MADIGISSKFEIQVGSTWTPVPGCKSIGIPGLTVSDIDTTTNDNLDYFKSFIPGTIDAGTIPVTCEYTVESYQMIYDLIAARSVTMFRVSDPESYDNNRTFEGYLNNISGTFETEAHNVFSFQVKVTGAAS